MWILQYLLNFSPQVFHWYLFKNLYKAVLIKHLQITVWFKQTVGLRLCFKPWWEALQPSRKKPPRETLITAVWCIILLCLVGSICLVSGCLYKCRSKFELCSSNGSFKYNRTIKWWLHCTSAVSEWPSQSFYLINALRLPFCDDIFFK